MLKTNHLHSIHTGQYTLPLGILAFLVSVCLTFFIIPDQPADSISGLLDVRAQNWIPERWLSVLINECALIACAFLLVRLCDTYTLLHTRTPLTFLLFLLIGAWTPDISSGLGVHTIILPLFLAALFILYTGYQQEKAQTGSFVTGILIMCGTFVWSPFIYFIPLFWCGQYICRSLSLKCILASIIGAITPLWILFGFNLWPGLGQTIQNTLPDLITFDPITFGAFDLKTDIPVLLALVIGILTILINLFNTYQDKVRTRAFYHFIYIITLASIALMLINKDNRVVCLSLLNLTISLQGAHYFSQGQSKTAVILFYIIGIIYITTYTWTLL